MPFDGLATASRLVSALARVGLDGALPGQEVPRDLSLLDASAASRMLRERHPGCTVRALRILDTHSGTTARVRLALDYDGDPNGAPATLFAKLAPSPLAQRVFGMVVGLGATEVRFYREIAAQVPVRVPRVHAACATPDGRRFALLLEDLSGARFVTVGERATLADARAVVRELARLHASFWESPRFAGDLAWVRCLENRRRELRVERFLTAQMLRRAERRFADELPADFRAAVRLVCRERDALERIWAEGPRTLVHGDCHVGNLFFGSEGVGFLDWQVLARAPGLRDVSYFLCNSLPGEVREAHQKELVEEYRTVLGEQGAPAPSPAAAWDAYRSFSLYAFLSAAFTAAAGAGLQTESIGRAGLRRTMRALEELGAVGWLERRIARGA